MAAAVKRTRKAHVVDIGGPVTIVPVGLCTVRVLLIHGNGCTNVIAEDKVAAVRIESQLYSGDSLFDLLHAAQRLHIFQIFFRAEDLGSDDNSDLVTVIGILHRHNAFADGEFIHYKAAVFVQIDGFIRGIGNLFDGCIFAENGGSIQRCRSKAAVYVNAHFLRLVHDREQNGDFERCRNIFLVGSNIASGDFNFANGFCRDQTVCIDSSDLRIRALPGNIFLCNFIAAGCRRAGHCHGVGEFLLIDGTCVSINFRNGGSNIEYDVFTHINRDALCQEFRLHIAPGSRNRKSGFAVRFCSHFAVCIHFRDVGILDGVSDFRIRHRFTEIHDLCVDGDAVPADDKFQRTFGKLQNRAHTGIRNGDLTSGGCSFIRRSYGSGSFRDRRKFTPVDGDNTRVVRRPRNSNVFRFAVFRHAGGELARLITVERQFRRAQSNGISVFTSFFFFFYVTCHCRKQHAHGKKNTQYVKTSFFHPFLLNYFYLLTEFFTQTNAFSRSGPKR